MRNGTPLLENHLLPEWPQMLHLKPHPFLLHYFNLKHFQNHTRPVCVLISINCHAFVI